MAGRPGFAHDDLRAPLFILFSFVIIFPCLQGTRIQMMLGWLLACNPVARGFRLPGPQCSVGRRERLLTKGTAQGGTCGLFVAAAVC